MPDTPPHPPSAPSALLPPAAQCTCGACSGGWLLGSSWLWSGCSRPRSLLPATGVLAACCPAGVLGCEVVGVTGAVAAALLLGRLCMALPGWVAHAAGMHTGLACMADWEQEVAVASVPESACASVAAIWCRGLGQGTGDAAAGGCMWLTGQEWSNLARKEEGLWHYLSG